MRKKQTNEWEATFKFCRAFYVLFDDIYAKLDSNSLIGWQKNAKEVTYCFVGAQMIII